MNQSNSQLIGHEFIKKWLEIPAKLIEKEKSPENNDDDKDYLEYNDFFRFFCYYLAFNHIFDCYEKKNNMKRPFFDRTLKRYGTTENTKWKPEWKPDERERILLLVEEVFKRIRKNYEQKEWKSFEKNIDQILLTPVVRPNHELKSEDNKEVKEGITYSHHENDRVRDAAEEFKETIDEGKQYRLKMQIVFLRIYQVRCNLFHGSKEPNNERDVNLVKASADVLERFLQFCINDERCYGIIF